MIGNLSSSGGGSQVDGVFCPPKVFINDFTSYFCWSTCFNHGVDNFRIGAPHQLCGHRWHPTLLLVWDLKAFSLAFVPSPRRVRFRIFFESTSFSSLSHLTTMVKSHMWLFFFFLFVSFIAYNLQIDKVRASLCSSFPPSCLVLFWFGLVWF